MEERIKEHYRGERISNFIFFCYGAICSFFGFTIYFLRPSTLHLGFLFGFSIIGLFQMLVGTVRFYRSFSQYNLAIESCKTDKQYLKSTEIPRMKKLDYRYQKMRGIETISFIIGFLSFISFALMDIAHIYLGTAAGITLHSAVLLVFDLFGQFKTREYKMQLEKWVS